MTKSKSIEMIPLVQIMPDENQPRKKFDPLRLNELMKSIERLGIKTPLTVQRMSNGKYKIVDGERRYRASKELKLKEVPVIVEEATGDTELLIEQFHLQEQHEGWSVTEKALAAIRLSEDIGVRVTELSEILALSPKTIGEYVSFSRIIEKEEFLKNDVPIKYSASFNNLKTFAKNQYAKINEEFTKDDERLLEKAIIHRYKTGDITKRGDILKIHDSLRVDPKSIEKFMKNDSLTTSKLFLDSSAKQAYYYRNIKSYCNNLLGGTSQGLTVGAQKLFIDNTEGMAVLKKTHAALGDFINKIR